MNGYNFTEGVRKCLAHAREEAARLHHEYVGGEHMLLGILRRDEGVAISVMRECNVDLDAMRATIEKTVKRGDASAVTGPDLPYTTRAKAALELAMSEARELGQSYVGSEHLLLGLLREGKGIAAQVLQDAGLTLATARETMLRVVGEVPARGQRVVARSPSDRQQPTLVVVEVHYDGGWTRRREFRSAGEARAFLAQL
jgi:ATP-dependent Clp protease ATP-binding subunit ClpC